MQRLLVTGGAGFIGSHFVRHTLAHHPDCQVTVYDALTYAGNTDNFHDLWSDPRFRFVQGRIEDADAVDAVARDVDAIVNFAAESHNDRAILDPLTAARTNFEGVGVLLEAARKHRHTRFHQVSTDEVYGSTASVFREGDPLEPNQPYSAAKAGGELMVRAWHETYGLDTVVTRGSNTFGPYHYPEKLIPLMVTNAIDDLPLPVYGDGRQVREWMFVEDHCRGIDLVLRHGQAGGVYNLGSGVERENIAIVRGILQCLDKPESLIRYVTDRPGHDRRYAMDCAKVRALGFVPDTAFDAQLERTVRWYAENPSWWRKIKERQAEYRAFVETWYAQRR